MQPEKPQTERLLHKACVCKNCTLKPLSKGSFGSDENFFLPAVLSQCFGFPSLRAQKIPVPSILVSGSALIFNPLLSFEKVISVKTPLSEIISATKNALIDLLQFNHFHYSDFSLVLHSRLFERGGQLHDRFSLVLGKPGIKIKPVFDLKDPERIRIDESAVLFDFNSNSGWRFYPFHEEIKIIETCEVCNLATESLIDQHGWMPLTFHKVFYIESGSENPFPVCRFTGSQFRFYFSLLSEYPENSEPNIRMVHSEPSKQTSDECHVFNIDLTDNQLKTEWVVEIIRNQASWKKLKHLRMMVLNSAGEFIQAGDPEERFAQLIKRRSVRIDEQNQKILFR